MKFLGKDIEAIAWHPNSGRQHGGPGEGKLTLHRRSDGYEWQVWTSPTIPSYGMRPTPARIGDEPSVEIFGNSPCYKIVCNFRQQHQVAVNAMHNLEHVS